MTPLALTERDFDAYHPDRASSNAYSRPRLEFKQRALGWARDVKTRLEQLGLQVDVHASDEHPSVWNGHRVDCQWVFFWDRSDQRAELDAVLDLRRGIVDKLRDPSPYFRHAFLAMRLDYDKVEVCAQLHPDAWLDFNNLQARMADPARKAELVQVLSELPEQFEMGLLGEQMVPCASVSEPSLHSLVQQAAEQNRSLWVGWRVPRDVAIPHAKLLDEQLEDALVALASVYRKLSWDEGDDFASLKAQLEQMRHEFSRTAAERAAEEDRRRAETERMRQETTERSRERTRERVEYAAIRPRVTLANLFKSDTAAPAPRAPAREPKAPPAEPRPGPSRPAAATKQPAPARPAPRPAEEPKRAARAIPEAAESHEVLDKGARVRVLAGPFAGKQGVIGELDGRGGARVLLGLLSTRLAVQDLAPVLEGRDRPSLSSSHRSPRMPSRPAK